MQELRNIRTHADDFLLSRVVKNVGKNTVIILPDDSFKDHVIRHHKKLVDPVTLAPNEECLLANFYVIIHSSDDKPYSLRHEFKSK